MNKKGFTLIELLAVITIMGVLMIVAIPAVTRTIENSRKDTFLDMAKQYSSGLRTMWASDNLVCGSNSIPSSAVANGVYYIEVDSSSSSVPQVLESGGKSPWGNRDIRGYIFMEVSVRNNSRYIKFYPMLVDGIHGINVNSDGSQYVYVYPDLLIKRGQVTMNGATYESLFNKNPDGTYSPKPEGEVGMCFNQDDVAHTCNFLTYAVKCVEA